MIKNKSILSILILLFSIPVTAQVDSLFAVARNYAFNGQRDKARALCDTILKLSPGYSDVRILKGRTYTWDGKRKLAREEFNTVLSTDKTSADGWSALTDLEFWDDKSQASLLAADSGIYYVPTNLELKFKRVRALVDLAKYEEAKNELERIKKIDTVCTECKVWYDKIYEASAKSTIGFGVNIDYITGLDRQLHNYYVQFGKRAPKNTIIFKVNYNIRGNSTGFQPEIDMYPTLTKKAYLYLNYGFSIYDVFPKHRIGLELYHKLPWSMEASVGGRYMDFGDNSLVYIFTGSLTKYWGNYAFIFRPFITPDDVSKRVSQSALLNVRKYTTDADNYFGVTAGAGFSPDQRIFLTGSGLGVPVEQTSIYYLKAYRIGVAYAKTFTFRHLFLIDFDYRHQELKIGSSSEFYPTFSAGFSYKFRF